MSKSLSWDDLSYKLLPWIRTAIDAMGFESMTPVQAATIPMFAGNKDVVVESVTGSGKTIAFVIPVLERIVREEANRSNFRKCHFHTIIITPTKELASQIQTVIESFLKFYPDNLHPIRSQLLVGTNVSTVRDDFTSFANNRPQILVGTPGRLLDFLGLPSVKTSSCGAVILDEADKLLEMSFEKEIEGILKSLPKQRRTGLFSATISSAGNQVFQTGMRNPVKISVRVDNKAPKGLSIGYITVDVEQKLDMLLTILNNYRYKKCIVYFPTCIAVTYFYSIIQHLAKMRYMEEGLNIYSLHGKLQTSSRSKTLDTFTSDLNRAILLTTDVAARGIDIPDIDLVLQMDPPTDADIFLHRCGRTGRANRVGHAVVLLNRGREEDYIPFLEVKGINVEQVDIEMKKIEDLSIILKRWVLEDRARFDHGLKVYVAFIKYYSKHTASSIFRLQSLDYIGLAKCYSLLRLPRMPEIQNYLQNDKIPEDGWLISPPIDLDTFAYADKQKEKARKEALKDLKKKTQERDKKSILEKANAPWSKKLATKENKHERRAKMAIKRKAIEDKLALDGSQTESDAEEDWKDVIRQRKKAKKTLEVVGTFNDL
ncbi:HGL004Cp [Eremothecium sinecaudum]|uniref:ATP-dependent RNA helicase n=1 Tax=Eremothecium sinecaudum TaxID=45286 RepID=A0A109UY66_9SACH|nr:HGL004Cp [Eremothecium sinecaudum]AMD22336.1 HGL004Cp [Eremothecium sinecaudum]